MQFATNMMALPKRQHSAILMLEGSLTGAAKAAKKAAKPSSPKAPGSSQRAKSTKGTDTHTQTESPETDAQGPESPGAATGDYGKCPNCLGTKWDSDEFGVSCAKCHHPFGEPAGDVDEDRIKTQRQKTIKTTEALMRAFDDLNYLCARAAHKEAIRLCKLLLKTVKEWK